jgi:hypothetical protein
MPKFSIRFYHEYVDEYHVTAPDIEAAEALADAYTKDTEMIEKVADREYADYVSAYGCELNEDGSYGDSDEL